MTISPTLSAIAGVGLLLGAVLFVAKGSNAPADSRIGASKVVAEAIPMKSCAEGCLQFVSTAKRSSRKVNTADGYSIRQVRDALPDAPEGSLLMGFTKEGNELRDLFRRFGKLEGEAALDEIAFRYASNQYFTSNAMSFAIAGWMETDHLAAMKAFTEMTLPSQNPADMIKWRLESMSWKGTSVLSGVG